MISMGVCGPSSKLISATQSRLSNEVPKKFSKTGEGSGSALPTSETCSGPVSNLPKSGTGSDPVLKPPNSNPDTETPSDLGCSTTGLNNTNSQPNLVGTSPRSNHTVLKSTYFKKPKGFEIIGKGGKKFNPIPSVDTGNTVGDAVRAIGDDARCERLVAKVEETMVRRFTGTRELLPEDE